MKLLIDTNVILDMVLNRSGCASAMELFRKARETGSGAYVTASSVTDIFYILRKETRDASRTYRVMENIFRFGVGSCRDGKGHSGRISAKMGRF